MLKYLQEIKIRLFLLFLTWLFTVLISYAYKEVLLCVILQVTENYNSDFYFIFTNVTEIFSVYIKLITFLGNQILFLYLFYHLFGFFSPALFKTEYNFIDLVMKLILTMFLLSLLLFNYFFIPLTWNFFLSFQNFIYFVSLHFETKLDEYLIFYISLYYICVFYCQMFLGFFFALNYLNANVQSIKKFRKIYYYLFLIFSTFISPPDIISQICISFLLIFFYEFCVAIFILKTLFDSSLEAN